MNREAAEQIFLKILEDTARVDLLRSENYEYLLPEWNPEKENKSKQEMIEFANGRKDGLWIALDEFCNVPWEDINITKVGHSRIKHYMELLERVRDGGFDREISVSEEYEGLSADEIIDKIRNKNTVESV